MAVSELTRNYIIYEVISFPPASPQLPASGRPHQPLVCHGPQAGLSHVKALRQTKCDSVETTIGERRVFSRGQWYGKARGDDQYDNVCTDSRWKKPGARWTTGQLA